jgi:hypothetical protein
MTKTEGALMFILLLAAVGYVGYRQEQFHKRLVLVMRRAGRGHVQQERTNREIVT